LILIRARNVNTIKTIWEIQQQSWHLNYLKYSVECCLTLNEVNKLSMLWALESGRYLSIRYWVSVLGNYMSTSYCRIQWSIPGPSRLQFSWKKSRYVIFGLQTDKKMTTRKTYFDTYKLINVKFYLNSEFYCTMI